MKTKIFIIFIIVFLVLQIVQFALVLLGNSMSPYFMLLSIFVMSVNGFLLGARFTSRNIQAGKDLNEKA